MSNGARQILLSVYRTEPVLNLAVKTGFTPTRLGLLFFVCAGLVLSVWANHAEPEDLPAQYLDYWGNISWPVSLLLLFPLIVALTLIF